MGDFRRDEDGGGGGEFMLGIQPYRRQPLVLRMTVSSLVYGTAEATGFQDVCDAFTCWTEEVRYNARDHTMTVLQFGPEFMATDGHWRPFGYAVLGYTFFNSWANIQPTTPTGQGPESQTLFSSHNASSSYGTGLRYVRTKFGREHGFEFGFRFTRNAEASYLTERGISRNQDGTYSVSPRTGAANVLGIHIGYWMGPYINWNERR